MRYILTNNVNPYEIYNNYYTGHLSELCLNFGLFFSFPVTRRAKFN